jgi:hypothetical protein
VDENARVPAAPDDRRILVFAGALVLGAGIAVAALLFLATGGTQDTPTVKRPVFLGLARELRSKIKEGGPLYFASPFGDNGFWLDLENGSLVALDIVRPGSKECIVKWRDPRGAYVDCEDHDLTSTALDRFQLVIGRPSASKSAPRDAVYVDLRHREPAPLVETGGG